MKNYLKTLLLLALGLLILFSTQCFNINNSLKSHMIFLVILFLVLGVFTYIKYTSLLDIIIDIFEIVLEFIFRIF